MFGIVDSGEKIVGGNIQFWVDAGQLRSYPRTGTRWSDLSGNGKNGTLTANPNTPTFNSANGGIIDFDRNGYIAIGTNTNIGNFGTGNFTITGWYKRITAGPFAMTLIGDYPGAGGTDNWQISAGSNSGTGINSIDVYRNGTGWLFQQSVGTATTNWVNFAVTRIGSTVRLYANGSQIGSDVTNSNSWGVNGDQFNIAAQSNGGGMLEGSIANMIVYKDKGLTATEVSNNYNALRRRFGL